MGVLRLAKAALFDISASYLQAPRGESPHQVKPVNPAVKPIKPNQTTLTANFPLSVFLQRSIQPNQG
jgi:hypothetical protein